MESIMSKSIIIAAMLAAGIATPALAQDRWDWSGKRILKLRRKPWLLPGLNICPIAKWIN